LMMRYDTHGSVLWNDNPLRRKLRCEHWGVVTMTQSLLACVNTYITFDQKIPILELVIYKT
jgi:hypothetical protein